ncbi:MAG: pyridoxal phosphate-dependent aminotransferase [Oligoflexia bacterium]|nr:pyridoxal phosphate-dependent aminotransferase [Oligoflexia bacterium]
MNRNLPTNISPLRAFSAMAKPTTIDLCLGKPYEDMPAELRHIVPELFANTKYRMDYSENAGFAFVRDAFEKHYGLPKNSLILTHGAQEALYIALLSNLNPGDEVLIPNPGFLAYAPMVKMVGAKPSFYFLKKVNENFHYDLELITKKITKKTKVILLNSPSNPTGSELSSTLLKEIIKKFPKIKILSDEVYAELDYEKLYEPLAKKNSSIISVNSLSKSHALTGWRIGWVVSTDPKIYKTLLVAHQYVSTCASVPSQHLANALLSNSFEKIRDHYKNEYQLRRDIFFQALGKLSEKIEKPKAGFYAFLPIPKKYSTSLEFAKALLNKNDILVVPGEFFGTAGKKHIRISYSANVELLRKAGELISKWY